MIPERLRRQSVAPSTPAPARQQHVRGAPARSRRAGVSRAQTGVVVVDLESSTVIYALNPGDATGARLDREAPARNHGAPAARRRVPDEDGGARSGNPGRSDLAWRSRPQGVRRSSPDQRRPGGPGEAVRARGITTVTGDVVGDESYFDTARTVAGWKPSFAKAESPLLSALVVDRGLLDGVAVDHPALAAAILFTRALEAAGVSVSGTPGVGRAPASTAVELTRRASPPLTALLSQMDTWSDNFIAEMLLKELGARLAGQGAAAPEPG